MLDSVKWLRVELADCEQSSHPRGIILKIIVGGVLPCSPNPDPISDQKYHFRTVTLSDLAATIHTRFHTCLYEIMSSLLRLEQQQ